MPRHFTEETHSGSRKGFIVGAVVALALIGIVAGLAFVLAGSHLDAPDGNAEAPEQIVDEPAAEQVVDDPAAEQTPGLPFSLKGASLDASLIEASEVSRPAELAGEWTFGGDYSQIGSLPIDGKTVFGSATDNPDDLSSYRAALITADGVSYLEDSQAGETFFEPQDGSGNSDRLVWRSSEITLVPSSGSDNWRVQTWDSASGRAVVLGSAELLNGTPETPAIGGEVVPVCNDTQAFFSSCLSEGDGWSPAVVAFDLSEEEQRGEVIGSGNYPAAVEGGALWASGQLDDGDGTLYGALSRWDGSESTEIFSVVSNEGVWGISGVWAQGGHAAVCFSSVDGASGCYIGIWSEDFSRCEALIHAPSPSAVGSLNDRWFVWGAGSQAENAGMYALEISAGELLDLGSTSGYSRPCVAAEGDAVLVPHENGSGAVTFSVGELQV